MVLGNRRGAVSIAEGCMFLAMALFAALLITLLVVAFFRFQEPPQQRPLEAPKSVPQGTSFHPESSLNTAPRPGLSGPGRVFAERSRFFDTLPEGC